MEVFMSELIRSGLTQAPTNNGWSKQAADSPRQFAIPDNRIDQDAVASAQWAVAEYLRDVGLCDPELIARESHEIVDRAHREPTFIQKEASLSEAAIQLTVKQLDRWLMALADSSSNPDQGHRPEAVAGSRLPDLLRRDPQAWKQPRPTEKVIESLRDNLTPVVPEPRPRPMRPQNMALVPSSLRRLKNRVVTLLGRKTDPGDQESDAPVRNVALSRRKTTRVSLAALTILTTALGTWMFCRVATSDGLGVAGYALALIFAVLFAWVAFSFWVATLGLIIQLQRGPQARQTVTGPPDLPPTAIVMPIYNENPRSVFANIRAIAESLKATGQEAAFSIFVLSDTTETNVWLE
jgi:membrane glycosyltransferase